MSIVKFDLPAGIKVKEIFEDLEGTITSRIERLNGCLQYYVEPPRKEDGSIIKGVYADFENLEVVDPRGKKISPDSVKFKFETGDRVRNRIHNKEGFVTVRRQDQNGCIHYWYENGEQNPENGSILEFIGFEQEFELVDKGLNKTVNKQTKKKQEPLARSRTGCRDITSSR